MWLGLFFATQYKSSVSSIVPYFRILRQVVAEKSLTEKSLQTDKQANKHNNRKGKNYILPIYFVPGLYLQKRQKLYTPYILEKSVTEIVIGENEK